VIRRALALIRDPAAEWRVVAAEGATTPRIAFGYVVPMSLLPALAWTAGTAMFPADIGGAAVTADAAAAVRAGIGTFAGSVLTVFAFSLAIAAVATLYGVRRDYAGAFRVAAYGATPVWLAGLLLVKPLLILVLPVAVMHACYLCHEGLQIVLGVRPGDAAEYVAISAFLTIAMSVLAGGILGFLQIM